VELRRFLFIAVIVIGAVSPPALAQIDQQVARCLGPHDASPANLRIEGCTWAIQSGRWSGKDLAFAYYNRGNAYFDNKEHDRAIADFSEAIRLDPPFAPTYNNRGGAYRIKGDYERAIADYDEAIRLDPKYALACYDRGLAHLARKSYDQAIADFSKAIELEPDFTEARVNRERAYERKKKDEGGASDLTRR
jgi:tetratricopeptide (TPR) repeat protein